MQAISYTFCCGADTFTSVIHSIFTLSRVQVLDRVRLHTTTNPAPELSLLKTGLFHDS